MTSDISQPPWLNEEKRRYGELVRESIENQAALKFTFGLNDDELQRFVAMSLTAPGLDATTNQVP